MCQRPRPSIHMPAKRKKASAPSRLKDARDRFDAWRDGTGSSSTDPAAALASFEQMMDRLERSGKVVHWDKNTLALLEFLRRSADLRNEVWASQERFAKALPFLRTHLSDDPTGKSHPVALARLVDYLLAALDDPVVCQSPRLVEITEMIAASLLDSSSRNLSWEQSLAPIIEEGSREKFAGHNRKRKSVAAREAFKEWVAKKGITVAKIKELYDIPKASIPKDACSYIEASGIGTLARAYNEVRKGTLKRGQPRKKK